MNQTVVVVYAIHEQVLLPLAGLIVPLLSFLTYQISRRWCQPRSKETLKSKMYMGQSVLSGVLIGQIFCHVPLWSGSDKFPLLFGCFFFIGGFALLRLAESVGKGWNTNKNDIPRDEAEQANSSNDIQFDVNKETMEEETYIEVNNVKSKETTEILWAAADKSKANIKRQWMLIVLTCCLAAVLIMDGFLLVCRHSSEPAFVIIICFYVNIACLTIAILGGMLHAGFHVTEEKRMRLIWWSVLSFTFMSMVVCSVIPVLLAVPHDTASYIINTPWFSCIYLFCMGCLLRLQQYYEKNQYSTRDGKQIVLDALLFTLALAASAATGYWL